MDASARPEVLCDAASSYPRSPLLRPPEPTAESPYAPSLPQRDRSPGARRVCCRPAGRRSDVRRAAVHPDPAGTPADVIAKLNKALNAAANDKDIIEKFSAIGFETAPGTPEALAQRNKAETAKWAKAIRDARIEAE